MRPSILHVAMTGFWWKHACKCLAHDKRYIICLPYPQSQGLGFDSMTGCLSGTDRALSSVSSSWGKRHGIPKERNLLRDEAYWKRYEWSKDSICLTKAGPFLILLARVLNLGKNAEERKAMQHTLLNKWTEIGYLEWVWTGWAAC